MLNNISNKGTLEAKTLTKGTIKLPLQLRNELGILDTLFSLYSQVGCSKITAIYIANI